MLYDVPVILFTYELQLMPISPNVLDIPIKQKRNQYEEYVLRVSLPPLTLQALPFKVAGT